jgi:DNA primase
MAGRISQKDIEEVRQRTNIADVINEYVPLRSAGGGELKGLCPFHDEKSPSFTVSPSKGFYHCFGCKEGGNVFDFVQKLDALSFRESVEKLASQLGMQLTYEDGGPNAEESNQRARILEANRAAAEFYQSRYETDDAKPGRDVLEARGFDLAACKLFGIGWAPKGWTALTEHLKSLGFSDDELVAAALSTKGDRGLYDKFRGRVIWPIRDQANSVIGFGARKIFDDDTGPKYLNTSETAVYHKSQVLYGIDMAKRDIAKAQQVVVVEGYTDVMACHLAGVTTAVATCGTAFGDEHIRILNRILSSDPTNPAQVIFNFDPDEAGQKAAMRAFNDASKFNAQTFMAIGPDGLDPSDLRTKQGDQAVLDMIANKKPLLEFAITRSMNKFDLQSREGQVGAARAAASLVSQIDDAVMRGVYEKFVADATSLDRSSVGQLVAEGSKALRRGAVSNLRTDVTVSEAPGDADGPPPLNLNDPVIQFERNLLMVMIQLPESCTLEKFARIAKANFSAPLHLALARVIYGERASGSDENLLERSLAKLDDSQQAVLRELAMMSIHAADAPARLRVGQGIINKALERTIDYEKNSLRGQRRQAEAVGDESTIADVDRQLMSLTTELHALRGKR